MRFLGSFSCRGTDVGVLSAAATACTFSAPFAPFSPFSWEFLNSGQFAQNFLAPSGVFPRPVNWIANTCSTMASNFGPRAMPQSFQLIRHAGTPMRSGAPLGLRYARIFDNAADCAIPPANTPPDPAALSRGSGQASIVSPINWTCILRAWTILSPPRRPLRRSPAQRRDSAER